MKTNWSENIHSFRLMAGSEIAVTRPALRVTFYRATTVARRR